jgi:hypothetical protein
VKTNLRINSFVDKGPCETATKVRRVLGLLYDAKWDFFGVTDTAEAIFFIFL